METFINDINVFTTLDTLIELGEEDLRNMRGCDIESSNFCLLEKHYQKLSDTFKNRVNEEFDEDLLKEVDDVSNKQGYTLFSKRYLEILKKKYQELRLDNPRVFIDATGVLYLNRSITCLEELYEDNYFNERPQHTMMSYAVNELLKLHPHQVYILTYCIDSLPAEECLKNRISLDFPLLDPHNVIIVPYGMNKTDFVPNGVDQRDVLIDDYNNNLIEWQRSGGKSIKFINTRESIEDDWIGSCIMHDDPSLPGLLSAIYDTQCHNELQKENYQQKNAEELIQEQSTWQLAMLQDEIVK